MGPSFLISRQEKKSDVCARTSVHRPYHEAPPCIHTFTHTYTHKLWRTLVRSNTEVFLPSGVDWAHSTDTDTDTATATDRENVKTSEDQQRTLFKAHPKPCLVDFFLSHYILKLQTSCSHQSTAPPPEVYRWSNSLINKHSNSTYHERLMTWEQTEVSFTSAAWKAAGLQNTDPANQTIFFLGSCNHISAHVWSPCTALPSVSSFHFVYWWIKGSTTLKKELSVLMMIPFK